MKKGNFLLKAQQRGAIQIQQETSFSIDVFAFFSFAEMTFLFVLFSAVASRERLTL